MKLNHTLKFIHIRFKDTNHRKFIGENPNTFIQFCKKFSVKKLRIEVSDEESLQKFAEKQPNTVIVIHE